MDPAPQKSDSESYCSPSPTPETRPNRWAGPPSTWLSVTEQERGLAASLDQLRDQDLSIHLYNAHVLKKRARRFWERKGKGEEFDEEGEGHGWAPPKGWTAWPLPAGEVPREGEIVGEDDGSDAFTFRRRDGNEAPSGMLEEQLVAVTLRFARERFEGREWAKSDEVMEDENLDRDTRVKDGTFEPSYVSRDGSEDIEDAPTSGQAETLDEEENEYEPLVKEQFEPLGSIKWLKPVISVDDERSAALLRPSIRHTLSKLDEVLVALHHARDTCHQYGSRSAANTDDEMVRGEDSDTSATPEKRPRGRPRKFANLAILPKKAPAPSLRPNDPGLFRAKKTHLGRPQKVYERLDGETQQEYLVRIARLQKKALPSFAALHSPSAPATRSPSAASERSRRSPAKRQTSEELKVSRQKKLGLRDWSEILGSAALVGFPPAVIARATQRCADLFGEGMSMMTLPEVPFKAKDKDFVATYQPEEIPDLGSVEDSSDSESSESEIKKSRSTSRSHKRKSPAELARNSWFCPIENCRRENNGFGYISGLRRHMVKSHSMADDEIDELLDDTEEMDGAVHIDRFLKPMRQRRGVRGVDKGPRKGRISVKKDDDSDNKDDDVEGAGEGSSSSTLDEGGEDGHGDEGSHSDRS